VIQPVVEKEKLSSIAQRKERHAYDDAANRLIFGNYEDLEERDIAVVDRGQMHVLGGSSKVTSTTGSGMAEGEEDWRRT
jgi:hypothetical protein